MTKNRLHKPTQIYHKGETPIRKNVRVIDEQGNEYEATYPKRAKGLVKHGRARFLSDDVICLACPPNSTDLEDSQMTDFLFHKKEDTQPTPVAPETPESPETPMVSETLEAPETIETAETAETPETPEEAKEEISTTYLLEQIEAVRKDTDYLRKALDRIFEMEPGAETKICAIQKMVTRREATNQQLIQFYSDLLFRMNPPKPPKMPDIHFDWGKKWSDLGDKVRRSVEFTPDQEAEFKRQIDKAVHDLKTAAKWGGESVQRYASEAMNAIRQATKGMAEPQEEPGSTLDKVTAILRDPSLSVEEKALILNHADEIRDLEESLQARVMGILGDVTLSVEEKQLILDHLDDLQELS